MELREPPRSISQPAPDGMVRMLLLINLVAILGLAGYLLLAGGPDAAQTRAAEHDREVASKLKAAGALDQAAVLYERYLAASAEPPQAQAAIAYSLGTTYLDQGSLTKALRWFYEAETLGAGDLGGEVGEKIVHTLERLGRSHAAKAALDSRVRLSPDESQHAADDPVVARIGEQEIRRSDVNRAADDMPPERVGDLSDPAQRGQFLRQYVAEELLWRKASKLEYDEDPEVLRRHAAMFKQLAIGKFIEREVVDKVEVDEADLRNFFTANAERYQQQAEGDEAPKTPEFDQVRQAVERDYRMTKIQTAYSEVIESELATEDVELFPEEMVDAS